MKNYDGKVGISKRYMTLIMPKEFKSIIESNWMYFLSDHQLLIAFSLDSVSSKVFH